jgi:hypothetical protein
MELVPLYLIEELRQKQAGEDTAAVSEIAVPSPDDDGAVAGVLDGKQFVLTGTFPELGLSGGTGQSLGKDNAKRMIGETNICIISFPFGNKLLTNTLPFSIISRICNFCRFRQDRFCPRRKFSREEHSERRGKEKHSYALCGFPAACLDGADDVGQRGE